MLLSCEQRYSKYQMRRRRPIGRTIYTIDYLLNKQPKALQKDPRYIQMINSLLEDPAVKLRKFNRRCYSLLHNGVIRPEHLPNFYRTYRLPKHAFFPLFFSIKRDYLYQRNEKKKERENYIKQKQYRLPEDVRKMHHYLIEMEKDAHEHDLYPLCKRRLRPKNKKQIDKWIGFSHSQWILFFEDLLEQFTREYPFYPQRKIDYIKAGYILQCFCMQEKTALDLALAKSNFRKLSRVYHPDTGGDPEMFIRLKWAKDILAC